ncbi:hypothetical protein BJ165DRAFT_1410710 [Panaeolus papilionaceus]|nr:hypothetical protein BJ165DRAFT_1410710 [Panaeolus papilionaceus]
MTTNTVQTEFSTQRPLRPHHYNMHRTSRILQSQRSDSPPSPPPLRMENTVRILSALAPQLNVPQAPIKRAPSQSGRNTPSVDIYSGTWVIVIDRPLRVYWRQEALHLFNHLAHPLLTIIPFWRIATVATGRPVGQAMVQGITHPTSSESEACTIESKNEFDIRSYTSSSSEAPSKNLRVSASSTTSAFLHRPVSYHCDQDLSSVVIDIGPVPEKTKRKARPPPLSIPGSGSSSKSESDGFTPDSMITPTSSSCSTARPWSHHSSPYSTATLSSVWPDQLPSDATKEKIGLPSTSELLKKLPLLPPHDIPSLIASASESGESLEPRSPIPPKTPFLPSNRRASKSLPGLLSNLLAGAAPDDDHCGPEKGGHTDSPRGSTSRSERETIMRKRRLSDPVPSSFDSHTYTPLPPPKSVSPINLGLSFDSEPTEDNNVPAEGSESHRPTIYETPLGPERDQQQDPMRRSSIHDTGVLVISRPRAEVMVDDMDDGVSYVESHHHPTIEGMSDTDSSPRLEFRARRRPGGGE